jgi:hypothetical protein
MIILSRQAWDKHREQSQKRDKMMFSQVPIQNNGSYVPVPIACGPQPQRMDVHYPMSLRVEV